MAFAYQLGLDFTDLHNVEEITTKILKNWREHLDQNVQPSHIHLFITLLEKGQQKKAIERKLTEIRLKNENIFKKQLSPTLSEAINETMTS
jgi:type III secretory pathway component EscR